MKRQRKPIPQPPGPRFLKPLSMVPAYDWKERKAISRILMRKGRKIDNYVKFSNDLREARINASVGLYESLRARPAAVRAALEHVAASLASARESIDGLGEEAGRLIRDAAEAQDPRPEGDRGETLWQWLEPPGSGYTRLNWVTRAMLDCEGWASEARARVELPPPGRPRANVARELVLELAEIWKRQTGQKPKISSLRGTTNRYGDFLDFCEAVAQPIWADYGIQRPAMQEIVHACLYRNMGKKKK